MVLLERQRISTASTTLENHMLGKPDKSERGEFPHWAFPLLGCSPHMFTSHLNELDMIVLSNWICSFVTNSIVILVSNTITFSHECLAQTNHFVWNFQTPWRLVNVCIYACYLFIFGSWPIGENHWRISLRQFYLASSNKVDFNQRTHRQRNHRKIPFKSIATDPFKTISPTWPRPQSD